MRTTAFTGYLSYFPHIFPVLWIRCLFDWVDSLFYDPPPLCCELGLIVFFLHSIMDERGLVVTFHVSTKSMVEYSAMMGK
jgi:hypothetical protein